MKALHLITRLDPGGSAENTLLTCRHLADRGWEVVLAAGPGRTEDRSWVEASGVPTVLIPALRRDPHPVADPRAFWQLLRIIRRERPDILHTHSAKGGILGRWAGRVARVPHVVHTPHGHVLYGYSKGIKNWLYLLAERLTAPVSDRLIALSEGERRESVEHGIGRPEQWVVIPSGVPLDSTQDRATEADRQGRPRHTNGSTTRIGVVARLEHVKGIDLLIEAAALLSPDGEASGTPFEISVWGDGIQREELARLVARKNLGETVRLVGTEEDVNGFLGGLDLYVQPSRNEGMGRALVLAQAHGLPVVASRVCGIPDVVCDGETGILVEPEDPAALAAALERLLIEPALRARFSTRASAWVAQEDETGFARFSVEAMVWRLARLYDHLMSHEK